MENKNRATANAFESVAIIVTGIVFVAIIVFLIHFGVQAIKFQGACDVQGGEVHDGLCIKDGVVIDNQAKD